DFAPDVLPYSYKCRITYVKRSAVVHVSEEVIELEPPSMPKLTITRRTAFAEGKYTNSIEITPRDHSLNKHIFRSYDRPDKDGNLESMLCDFLRPEIAFLRVLSGPFGLLSEVHLDLSNLGSINVDPQAAKKATPIPHPEELQPTGQGLAAALYG